MSLEHRAWFSEQQGLLRGKDTAWSGEPGNPQVLGSGDRGRPTNPWRMMASNAQSIAKNVLTCVCFFSFLEEPGWRNWQTQRTQNPPTFGSWGFDSPSRHQLNS